jgi:hypothetical protein
MLRAVVSNKCFQLCCYHQVKRFLSSNAAAVSTASGVSSAANVSEGISDERAWGMMNRAVECSDSISSAVRAALDYSAQGPHPDIEEAAIMSTAFRKIIHFTSATSLSSTLSRDLEAKKVVDKLFRRYESFLTTFIIRTEEEKKEIAEKAYIALSRLFVIKGSNQLFGDLYSKELRTVNDHNILHDDVTVEEYLNSFFQLNIAVISMYEPYLQDNQELYNLIACIIRVMRSVPLQRESILDFTKLLVALDARLYRLAVPSKTKKTMDIQAMLICRLVLQLRRLFAANRLVAEDDSVAKVGISLLHTCLRRLNWLFKRSVGSQNEFTFQRFYELSPVLAEFTAYAAKLDPKRVYVGHIHQVISQFFEIYADFLRFLPEPVLSPPEFKVFVTLLPQLIHIDTNSRSVLAAHQCYIQDNFARALISFLQANLASSSAVQPPQNTELLTALEFSRIILALVGLSHLPKGPSLIANFTSETYNRAFMTFLIAKHKSSKREKPATSNEKFQDFKCYFYIFKALAELESTERFISRQTEEQGAIFAALVETVINEIEDLYETAVKLFDDKHGAKSLVDVQATLLWSAARLQQHPRQEFTHRIAKDMTALLANPSSRQQTLEDFTRLRTAQVLWAIFKLDLLEPTLLERLCQIVLHQGNEHRNNDEIAANCQQLLVILQRLGPAAAPPALELILLRDLPLISRKQVLQNLNRLDLYHYDKLFSGDFVEKYQGNQRVAELMRDLARQLKRWLSLDDGSEVNTEFAAEVEAVKSELDGWTIEYQSKYDMAEDRLMIFILNTRAPELVMYKKHFQYSQYRIIVPFRALDTLTPRTNNNMRHIVIPYQLFAQGTAYQYFLDCSRLFPANLKVLSQRSN